MEDQNPTPAPSDGKYLRILVQPPTRAQPNTVLDPTLTVRLLPHESKQWVTPFALVDLVRADGVVDDQGLTPQSQNPSHVGDGHDSEVQGFVYNFPHLSIRTNRPGVYTIRVSVLEYFPTEAVVIETVETSRIVAG